MGLGRGLGGVGGDRGRGRSPSVLLCGLGEGWGPRLEKR